MVGMPGRSHRGPLPPLSDDQAFLARRLRGHVEALAHSIGERNVFNLAALQETAGYIIGQLKHQGYRVTRLPYRVVGVEVANIEAERKDLPHGPSVIVGAHYDTVRGSPGANDNGSGVAALLELARLFAQRPTRKPLRFVAFTNEEQPFFWTENMGSMVYARHLQQHGCQVEAMLALETMGYYSDKRGSQHYPGPFGLVYPRVGNFIMFLGNRASRDLVARCTGVFREHVPFPAEGAALPNIVPGVGWSDHWSFWQCGWPALMVTDTAPFRYPAYHTAQDTVDQINFEKLARVVDGLVEVIADLAS